MWKYSPRVDGAGHDSGYLFVKGLRPWQLVPAGSWVRIGDHEYLVLVRERASIFGRAVLSLSPDIRPTAGNARIKLYSSAESW